MRQYGDLHRYVTAFSDATSASSPDIPHDRVRCHADAAHAQITAIGLTQHDQASCLDGYPKHFRYSTRFLIVPFTSEPPRGLLGMPRQVPAVPPPGG